MATLSVGKRLRSERGAEIIEMALVTPIFLIIIAAMFDFGFLFRNWEVATNAAREGARIGLLPAYKCDGSTADVKDRVDAYMKTGGPGNGTVLIVNILGFFVDKMQGNDVEGYLMTMPDLLVSNGGGVAQNGSFIKAVQLVR